MVTGGLGFIGSHMVDFLLEKGFTVRVIDNLSGGRLDNLKHHIQNPNLSIKQQDIRDIKENDVLFKDVKYVFHFAGIGDIVPSIENPTEYMDVNVQGTVKILEAARYAKVEKFIYAASSSCYGLADTPTTENHPIKLEYPYALSKYMGECSAFHWHKCYGLPVNSIRIFNAYGTRSRTSGAYGAVFGVFLKQKLSNHPFTIVGDGTQSRDFLYVTDVAKAFYAAAQTEKVGEIYNLGAGDPKTVNYLVELLGGKSIHIPRRPGEPDCTWANITKIQQHLQWKPEVSFEEGVEKIMANIDYWVDAPLWTPKKIEDATSIWFQSLNK